MTLIVIATLRRECSLTEDLDTEVSLYVRPHRAYETLFVLELIDPDSSGDGSWSAQSERAQRDVGGWPDY